MKRGDWRVLDTNERLSYEWRRQNQFRQNLYNFWTFYHYIDSIVSVYQIQRKMLYILISKMIRIYILSAISNQSMKEWTNIVNYIDTLSLNKEHQFALFAIGQVRMNWPSPACYDTLKYWLNSLFQVLSVTNVFILYNSYSSICVKFLADYFTIN